MNIFAIDLGNKRIKMKSDRSEYVYPASYLNGENVSKGPLAGWNLSGNQTYILDKESNNSFIWGTDLDVYHLSEKMIDTYARTGRIQQKKVQRILKFALGRLALDYKEARTRPLVVNLVLGLPITDLHEESKAIEKLKEILVGRHSIRVDGIELNVEIPSEDYIDIIPQYMGTAFELAFDEKLQQIDKFAKGRMGILDIGGGTILTNVSNRLNPEMNGDERFEGIQTLIKNIAGKINSTKLFSVEKILQDGNMDGEYVYSPNHNSTDYKNITDIVKKSIEDYTRFTVAPLITENFPDIESLDFIVMTGGGANLLDRNALLDEIGEDYFSHLIFIESSERANVRGFYKFAVLKMNGGVEDSQTVGNDDLKNPTDTSNKQNNNKNNYSEQLKQVQSRLKDLKQEIEQEID
ncbi:MAG: hypothetical protein ACI31W_06140 [Lactococcus sp.]